MNSTGLNFNNYNSQRINFTGLSRTLSKKAYEDASLIKSEVLKYTKSKGIVGNLPKEWIEKIPIQNREARIKNLYADFKNIVNDFRAKVVNNSSELKPHLLGESFKIMGEKLQGAFEKAGIKTEKLSINYLDYGSRGLGLNLTGISNNRYMMKIFYSNDFLYKGLSNGHGNYIESNRAMFLNKGKNDWIGFNFGDINAGFLVEKFIGKNTPKYKGKVVPEQFYGLKNQDEARLNGYQYDYGGLYVVDKTLSQNKTARFVYKKLYYAKEQDRTDMTMKFLGMKKYRNNKDIKLGLACSLDLLPEQERTKCFKVLMQNADVELKNELLNKLSSLPANQRNKFLNEFMQKSDKQSLIELADKV